MRRAAARPDRPALAQVAEEDEGLLAALKARRRALADAAGVPAYVIFPDRTLIEMATRRPATLDALAGITGVGAVKLDRFGRDFLAILTGDAPPPVHPARRKLAGPPAGGLFDRLRAAQIALARGADGWPSSSTAPPRPWRASPRSGHARSRRSSASRAWAR